LDIIQKIRYADDYLLQAGINEFDNIVEGATIEKNITYNIVYIILFYNQPFFVIDIYCLFLIGLFRRAPVLYNTNTNN